MIAVGQFRSLRSEQHIATVTAVAEAEQYGATFGITETERAFRREEEHLKTFEAQPVTAQESSEARKRWKMIVNKKSSLAGGWSRGEEYVRLWKEGVRPDYTPSLTSPVDTVPNPESTEFALPSTVRMSKA